MPNLPDELAPPRPRKNLFASDEYRLTVRAGNLVSWVACPSLAGTLHQIPQPDEKSSESRSAWLIGAMGGGMFEMG
jgi:hypothetical protein